MSSEVLIYVQNFKKYFFSNPVLRDYFNVSGREETFFDNITEISEKNFEIYNEPHLNIEQFEEIKRKMNETKEEEKTSIGIFLSLGEYGMLSLN